MLDRIIFGDNQFFGINHMSEEKAQALSEKFKNLTSIINVLDTAYDCGIKAFMLNSHDRAMDICAHFRKYPGLGSHVGRLRAGRCPGHRFVH